ncbi:DUF4231 domain-containing protein [Streptomyces sp. ME03-5709C]|nr:DUF4231 domain-containing protein [Streptomyces sp. ME03-5709C]
MVTERELLPDLFRAADQASLRGQWQTVRLSRQQLVLLTAASVFSSFDATAGALHWTAWLAAALFALAAWTTWVIHRHNPQGLWYEGRALAESLKTLTWKYSVGADPFTPPGDERDPDAQYRLRLGDVLHTFRRSRALPSRADTGITPAMRRLRDAPLRVRHDVYLRERIRVQHEWYTAKAARCEVNGRRAGRLAMAFPLLGVLFLALRAGGWSPFDTLGFVSAITASVAAWAQLRQYSPLAAAYRVAADELELVRVQLASLDLDDPHAEHLWSQLTRDAEDAVSREHTTWQARREMRA